MNMSRRKKGMFWKLGLELDSRPVTVPWLL